MSGVRAERAGRSPWRLTHEHQFLLPTRTWQKETYCIQPSPWINKLPRQNLPHGHLILCLDDLHVTEVSPLPLCLVRNHGSLLRSLRARQTLCPGTWHRPHADIRRNFHPHKEGNLLIAAKIKCLINKQKWHPRNQVINEEVRSIYALFPMHFEAKSID